MRCLLAPLLLTLSLCAQDPRAAQVDKLFARWNKDGSAGCAVAVAQGDKMLHVGCYGMRDTETKDKITPNTAFYAASVSKQFVAASIALLAKQGKLSLDDDVRKHVPELSNFGKTITIRHLILHRSGLRDMFELMPFAGWNADKELSADKVLGLICRQKELNFEPGTDFLYSNTGYFLLAVIVGRVSKSSLREYSTKHMFEPIGMKRSVFKDDPDLPIQEVAIGHSPGVAGYQPRRTRFALVGSGGLYTTVADLVRWMHNFDTIGWGGKELLTQLQTPPNLKSNQRRSPTMPPYAFGLTVGKHKGVPMVGHAGGSFGYRAFTVRFPKQKLYVAVLGNAADLPAPTLAQRVADIYLKDEVSATEAVSPKKVKPPVTGVTFFQNPTSRDVAVLVPRANDVRLALLRWQVNMQPTGKDTLSFDTGAVPVTATVSRDKDGDVSALVVRVEGQDALNFDVLPKPSLSKEDWNECLGTYESDELDADLEVQRRGDSLRFRGKRMSYTPISKNTFVASRGGQLDFERDDTGKITAVRVSSRRAWKMFFRRK